MDKSLVLMMGGALTASIGATSRADCTFLAWQHSHIQHFHADQQVIWMPESIQQHWFGAANVAVAQPIQEILIQREDTNSHCTEPLNIQFTQSTTVTHEYTVGGVTEVTANVSAGLSSLVGSVTAAAGASVQWNHSTTNSNQITQQHGFQWVVQARAVTEFRFIAYRKTAGGSRLYREAWIQCRNLEGDLVTTICGDTTVTCQAVGYAPTYTSEFDGSSLDPCEPDVDPPDDDGGAGPGGPGPGGPGPGEGGLCEWPTLIGGDDIIGIIVEVGEELLGRLPLPPCDPFYFDADIRIVPGGVFSVKFVRRLH